MNQTTLNRVFTCTGVGLHSGQEVRLTLSPAPANTGIVFMVESDKGVARICPKADAVQTTELATTLGNGQVSVSTVEHVLAALRGLRVDNVEVRVSGPEMPIMDGSALIFARRIREVGLRVLPALRKVLRLTREMELHDGHKYIHARPVSTPGAFRVNYFIDFPHPVIGRQRATLDVTPESFSCVAMARTFGFLKDIEYLHSKGLARGGSMDNAVVLDETHVLNTEGLRGNDEFVRHKLLDFIGDMGMARLPLEGAFTVSCSGHGLNNRFLRMLEAEGALEEVEIVESDTAASLYPERVRAHYVPSLEGTLALA